MKRLATTLFVFLLISLVSQAQTIIRFVPEKSAKLATNQAFGKGKIEQVGQNFSRRVRVHRKFGHRMRLMLQSRLERLVISSIPT